MGRIQYRSFSFTIPQELNSGQYNIYKQILSNNPKKSINTRVNFFETFSIELMFLGVGILGIILVSLDIAEWLTVSGFILMLALFVLYSFIPSMFTYFDLLNDKRKFYIRLKIDIINADNYEEFIRLRKERRTSLKIY